MNDLKEKFEALSDEGKVEFFKSIMPSMCEIFKKDPQGMMKEMMPFCREMQSMNMPEMMEMMKGQKNK
ncbi:hypothetical protein Mzhil_1699 [Methanosalsum zhilinae DSM 4017]|uniref:Uncharacterized protein n=1 Tax=Methanosalsum zhilinae (strain DSM 4017 / NBRC 107636 / OCM 62 / WeN5) TaxID=679901 RepID=F7XQ07_METZD|nr:hypothetical protein [Methanosalsum zhilinae]AEH61534.1 hypothetical protein Mzhil_1699 [Methanosalsum zhilinae DSM 4017]